MTRKVSCLVAALAFAATMLVAAVPVTADTRTAAASGTPHSARRGPAQMRSPSPRSGARRCAGDTRRPARSQPTRGQFPPKPLPHPVVASQGSRSNPELGASFDGLTSRDQRLANGGNAILGRAARPGAVRRGRIRARVHEHRDQGQGHGGRQPDEGRGPEQLLRLPAQLNRTTGAFGPFLTDPVCLFVPSIDRWVQLVLTIDQIPSGPLAGAFPARTISISRSATLRPDRHVDDLPDPGPERRDRGTPDNGCPA